MFGADAAPSDSRIKNLVRDGLAGMSPKRRGRPNLVDDDINEGLVKFCELLRQMKIPIYKHSVMLYFTTLIDGTALADLFTKDGLWDIVPLSHWHYLLSAFSRASGCEHGIATPTRPSPRAVADLAERLHILRPCARRALRCWDCGIDGQRKIRSSCRTPLAFEGFVRENRLRAFARARVHFIRSSPRSVSG